MKFEIKNKEEILYPLTASDYVLGKDNYNMKQILNELRKSINELYIYDRYMLICYEKKQNTFNIEECIKNKKDYNITVYLNGTLLTNKIDYNIHKNNIILKKAININDNIIIETTTTIKNLKNTPINKSCNPKEKVLINNIINRINIYSKTLKMGVNIDE